jgi:hypothetical protein
MDRPINTWVELKFYRRTPAKSVQARVAMQRNNAKCNEYCNSGARTDVCHNRYLHSDKSCFYSLPLLRCDFNLPYPSKLMQGQIVFRRLPDPQVRYRIFWFTLFVVFPRLLKFKNMPTILYKIYCYLLPNPYLTTSKNYFLMTFNAVN